MEPAVTELATWVRTAQGDLWQVEGRLRHGHGGGVRDVPGARLWSSGLAESRWNNADVTDPAAVDLALVRAWFATRREGAGVPWGVRVPAGAPWPHGRLLFRKRLAALLPGELRPAAAPPGLLTWEAKAGDEDLVAAIDAAAFDMEVEESAAWVGPQLQSSRHHVIVARLDGAPAAIAVGARSFDRAGPCLGLTGLGVLGHARGRGVEGALVTELAARGLSAGARLVHAAMDDEDAEHFAAVGFHEVDGLDVYVDA